MNCHKGTKVTVPETETAALALCEPCNEHTITGLRVIIELRPRKFYRDGGIQEGGGRGVRYGDVYVEE